MTAQLNEERLKDRAKIRRSEARRIEEGKSKTRVELEDDMRIREKKIGNKANDHVAREMSTIVEIALQDWSAQVQAQLSVEDRSNGVGAKAGAEEGTLLGASRKRLTSRDPKNCPGGADL